MASRSEIGINDLPNEVLLAIFSELTVPDLARCAATCQRWHGLVSGCSSLWRGKFYVCSRSPRESAETQAVLRALPPSLELGLETGDSFSFDILYPRAALSVTHLGILDECPRLRCSCLATRVDFAGDILTYRSVVDFEELKKLRILRKRGTNAWSTRSYSEDYVVGTALSAFPNLTELFVGAESLSADYLDALHGFAQLRVLEIECPGLERLAFLRHCSVTLEALVLVSCTGLPSAEYRELRQLRSLRKLLLIDCPMEEADLAVALAGAASLELLKLLRSVVVRDLSLVRPCGRLREFCLTNWPETDALLTVSPEVNDLEFRLPVGVPACESRVVGVSLNVEGVWRALPELERIGLAAGCLHFLAPLRLCPQMRHFCCEFVRQDDQPQLLNLPFDIDDILDDQ